MATTTIGPGQTYTTLAAWAAYVNALSLSADEIGRVVGTCSDTARVTVNGWTANGFSVILEASPGTGVNDGGRLWWLSSGRAVLSNSVSYDTAYFFTGTNLIVRNLQIRTTASNSNSVIKQGGGSSIVERCVIQNAGNSYAHDFVSGGGAVRLSLIISGPNSGGVRDGGSGGSSWVRRCTIVSGGGTSTCLQSSYGTLGAQGSAVYGFSTIASGAALSGSGYNAISGTTWGGSGWSGSGQTGLTAADFASTGSGTEDYAPASGSTRLVNTGTAVSGVSADIFGTAVPQGAAADIGAAEYAAAATDTRPPGRRASRRAAPTLPEWAHRHSRKGSRLVVLGAGGAQSGEVTESTSAGDAVSAVLIRAGGVSEDASAADSQSATGGLVAAVADAAAAGDTVEAALVIAVGVAESAGPTDAAAAALALALAIVDAATAGDSSAATAALAAAVDEAQSAADGVSAGLQAAAAVSESQTAGDAQTAVAVLVAALTEASTPVDTQSTGPVVTGDVAESASATDTITAIAALAAEQAESTAAADAITAVAQMVAQIAEATTAADAVTAGLTMLALLTEAATPADTVTGTVGAVTHNVSIEEVATALDTLVAFMLSRNSAPPVSQRLQGALRAVSLQTARRVNVQKSRR